MDGRTSVQDLVDQSAQGEFDVHRILYDLLNRSLIEEAPPEETPQGKERMDAGGALVVRAALIVLAAASLASVVTLGSNSLAPWRVGSARSETDSLRAYVSRGRLERIEGALQMFYLDTGAAPDALEILVRGGYLDSRDLLDPWGRAYGYDLSREGYRLFGRDVGGEPRQELTLIHRFSPAQRMILEGPAYVGGTPLPARP